MIFYTLLLCGLICSSCCVSFTKDKYLAVIFKFVTFLILFLPAAFRYGIGVDYPDYIRMFYGIPHGEYKIIEPGWRILNLAVFNAGGNGQMLIAAAAFLIYFFILCDIDRKKWFLFVPVYFISLYMWSFTTLRQILVVSMVFCSMNRWNKGKKISAIVIFTLSYFFHKSAVLYIPIFVLCKILRINKYLLFAVFIGMLVITEKYSSLVINAIYSIIGITQYSNYLTSRWIGAVEKGMGRYIRYIVYALLILFYPETKPKTAILPCYVFLICVEVFSVNMQILGRINRGLLFVFMPLMWDGWHSIKNRQIHRSVYVLCFILLFIRNFGKEHYVSIFDMFLN